MVAVLLAQARPVVCASPVYLEEHGVPQHPEDLRRHNCLIFTPRDPPDVWQFETAAGLVSVGIDGDLRSNTGDALRIAAIRGCGLAQLPNYMVGLDLKAGRLRAVLEDYQGPARPINAVYLHRQHLSAKVRTFVDFLVKSYQPAPYWEAWTR